MYIINRWLHLWDSIFPSYQTTVSVWYLFSYHFQAHEVCTLFTRIKKEAVCSYSNNSICACFHSVIFILTGILGKKPNLFSSEFQEYLVRKKFYQNVNFYNKNFIWKYFMSFQITFIDDIRCFYSNFLHPIVLYKPNLHVATHLHSQY